MKFFLKRKIYKIRTEGEIIPPWYYGLVYIDYIHGKDIFAPIPLNYIIRLARNIEYCWDTFRSKPTWIDRRVERFISEIKRGRIE